MILITGGAGFIGQHLSRRLVSAGRAVRVLDSFHPQIHGENARLPDDIAPHVELIRADVRDRIAVSSALRDVSTVVHLAAETGTGQSMYEIERYYSANVLGTAVLLEAIQHEDCKNSLRSIVLASSRAVYGEGAYRCEIHGAVFPEQRARERLAAGAFEPTCPECGADVRMIATPEDAPLHPSSVYGLTKQMQEQAILLHAKTHSLAATALRFQNVFGPGQSLKNPYTGILAVFSNLARRRQPIEVYEDGRESRDFIFVGDVVESLRMAIESRDQFVGPINVGSGVATSVRDVAERVNEYFGGASPIRVTGAFRYGDVRHCTASTERARAQLGFQASVSFVDGLKAFLDWAERQEPGDEGAYERSVAELESKGLLDRSEDRR